MKTLLKYIPLLIIGILFTACASTTPSKPVIPTSDKEIIENIKKNNIYIMKQTELNCKKLEVRDKLSEYDNSIEKCFKEKLNKNLDNVGKYYKEQEKLVEKIIVMYEKIIEIKEYLQEQEIVKAKGFTIEEYFNYLIKEGGDSSNFHMASLYCPSLDSTREKLFNYFMCLSKQKFNNKDTNKYLELSAHSANYIYASDDYLTQRKNKIPSLK